MHKRIYIVEDEVIIALEIERTLAQLGYQPVGTASNYDDALRGIEESQPDLILIDITLKGSRSGIDIAKTLNQTHPIPVIFLTSVTDERTMLEAITTAPVSYLLKPFRREELHSAILLSLRHPENDPAPEDQVTAIEGGYHYHLDRHQLYDGEQLVKLGPKERHLIHVLIEAKGEAVPYNILEETIWEGKPVAESGLRTLLYRLHKKLGCKIVKTVPAFGCRLPLAEEYAPKNS
jgi:DNA-binding response OmpR family regulator